MSIYHQSLQSFEPYKIHKTIQKHLERIRLESRGMKRKKIMDSSAVMTNRSNYKSSQALFHNSVFYLLQSSSSAINRAFTINLENDIKSNGGHILTTEKIQNIISKGGGIRLRCYVVYPNGQKLDNSLFKNTNLLLKVSNSKMFTKMQPITPVWIKTCIFLNNKSKDDAFSNKLPSPDKYSMLFRPQPWPLQLIKNQFLSIKISITGFVDIERIAIIQLFDFLNIPYTDTLQKTNTHLIHPNLIYNKSDNTGNTFTSGTKFLRALEWGLHVVCIDWLYHVMRYGFTIGCEHGFSMSNDFVKK